MMTPIATWLTLPLLDDSFPLPLDAPFTAAQAQAAGVSRRWLHQLKEAGLLWSPVKSVYVVAQVRDDLPLRINALRLVVPPDAVVCDRHAGWVQGAEMVLLPNEHLNSQPLTVDLPAGRGRLRNKLTDGGERKLLPSDVVDVGGLRVTSPLRTALDLGRHRFPEPSLSGMDALLRLGAFTREELVGSVERFRGMRWVTTLRAWAPYADGRAQSPGESALRLRWLECGLPAVPQPQVEVESHGRLAFLDLGDPLVRYAIEYDGWEWHSDPLDRKRDADRRSWLRRDEGWVIDAVGCDEVYGRDRTVYALMHRGYAEARGHARGRLSA